MIVRKRLRALELSTCQLLHPELSRSLLLPHLTSHYHRARSFSKVNESLARCHLLVPWEQMDDRSAPDHVHLPIKKLASFAMVMALLAVSEVIAIIHKHY